MLRGPYICALCASRMRSIDPLCASSSSMSATAVKSSNGAVALHPMRIQKSATKCACINAPRSHFSAVRKNGAVGEHLQTEDERQVDQRLRVRIGCRRLGDEERDGSGLEIA